MSCVAAAVVFEFSFNASAYNKITSAKRISIQSKSGPPLCGNLGEAIVTVLMVTSLLKSPGLASNAAIRSVSNGSNDLVSKPPDHDQNSEKPYSSGTELEICVAKITSEFKSVTKISAKLDIKEIPAPAAPFTTAARCVSAF